MSKKGAIELSMNFIVVIIISSVIVVGSLALFFNLKDKMEYQVDVLDQQTQDRIKSMMLSGNYRVAAYPQDPIIENGNTIPIGVGVTNNINTAPLTTFSVNVSKIMKYVKDGSNGVEIRPPTSMQYYNIASTVVTIRQGEQIVKTILLTMPKNAENAQYVYTINVTVRSVSGPVTYTPYGVVQVYATNP
jgi:hypothetical protein